ncbi:hypothetical protein Slin15195_G057400 [Septoria linicola]|uniref:Uncharacterized protein n=1 Tax=Septoria linicola TaxID=215465 RepID=A0A9Q9AXF6_9PEZI|nr:hypothetical protein Slin14017_G073270 [Septoria linicola]USW52421.1 hypothetical protein Slin15195_G057400 [Septoria linicola]
MAMKVIEKADILTEASWPAWRSIVTKALEQDGEYTSVSSSGRLGAMLSTTRPPLNELSIDSSQSPLRSLRTKIEEGSASVCEDTRQGAMITHSNAIAQKRCSFEKLSDFHSLLDRIERTSPMAVMYLDAYAERLHVDVCKNCWFTATMLNMPDDNFEESDEEEVCDKRSQEKSTLPDSSNHNPQDLATPRSRQFNNTKAHVPTQDSAHFSTISRAAGAPTSLPGYAAVNKAPPGLYIAPCHRLGPRFMPHLSASTVQASSSATNLPSTNALTRPSQILIQASDWLRRQFVTDAAACTPVTVLWQTYKDTYAGTPTLNSAQFLPNVLSTFPGSRSKYLPDGKSTYVVEGIRQRVVPAATPLATSSTLRAVSTGRNMAMLEVSDHFVECLQSHYVPCVGYEVSISVIFDAYRTDTVVEESAPIGVAIFLRSLRRAFPNAQSGSNGIVARHFRPKTSEEIAATDHHVQGSISDETIRAAGTHANVS